MKLGEIKFFNRLVKDFGNDKQLGFAEEAFRRVADAGLERDVYDTPTCSTRAFRVKAELDRARRTWSDMLAAGVQPNEVTYTVLVKGLAQEGFLEEAANVVEEMRRGRRRGQTRERSAHSFATAFDTPTRRRRIDVSPPCAKWVRNRTSRRSSTS